MSFVKEIRGFGSYKGTGQPMPLGMGERSEKVPYVVYLMEGALAPVPARAL